MNEPEWLDYDVVRAIHEAQLAEHGGLTGIRDEKLLDSALVRPKNLFANVPGVSLYQLGAMYALGIAQNHPFIDGNKRTAWVLCAVFLELNGISVEADQAEVVRFMFGIAAGAISEEEFVRWLEQVDRRA